MTVWKYLEDSTRSLFKLGFIYPLIWFVSSTLIFLSYYILQDFNINIYRSIGYTFLIFIIDCLLYIELYVGLVGKEEWKNILDAALKTILKKFELLVFFFILLIPILVILLLYVVKNFNKSQSYIFIIYFIVFTISIFVIDIILFVDLWGKREVKDVLYRFGESPIKFGYKELKLLIVGIIIIIFIVSPLSSEIFTIAPSILLMGSFSIEEFPQSIDNADTLTFTIRETGLTYIKNYIIMYKLNAENNSLNVTDNITLPIQLESQKKLMFGGIHDKGIWYLNINTSRLQPGNYLLHADVTNDLSYNSSFGVFKKHADKLFYIAPKSTNYSLNSTQALRNSSD